MSHSAKLSLPAAILINLNVMVGSGVFINTVLLSKNAGGLGAAAYALVGILLLPLILSMSSLARIHRGGTFYDYGSHLGTFGGFLTMASYFLAKLSSCAVAIHVCISLLQTIFPPLKALPILLVDCCVVLLFAALNTRNLRVGKQIQLFFIVGKFIPITFVILTGFYLFSPGNFAPENLLPSGIVTSVPFILYAFMGFEASCSLSRFLQDPERNGPRAMLISYLLGITVVCLFQFMFYASLGPLLASLGSYLEAFPALLGQLPLATGTAVSLKALLHLGIASSVLGTAYGIMYSNAWNLYELAVHGHVVKQKLLVHLNQHQIPIFCVFVEAVIVIGYLLASQGNQVPLQQISASGSTIAYMLCAVSLVVALYRLKGRIFLMPLLGVASCLLLLGALCRNYLVYGVVPVALFALLLLLASSMFRSNGSLMSSKQ